MKRKQTIAEVRNAKMTSQFERAEDKSKRDKMLIRGYPILFNTPTKIRDWFGEYEEKILPTALDETELSDVYLLGGHNPDNLLGRVGKNMRVEKDETGLFFECELPNTQLARDYFNLVESGILDGMSFGFRCEFVDREDGSREIIRITELYEITLTPFPAYYEASVVPTRVDEKKEDDEGEEEDEKNKETDVNEISEEEDELKKMLEKIKEV